MDRDQNAIVFIVAMGFVFVGLFIAAYFTYRINRWLARRDYEYITRSGEYSPDHKPADEGTTYYGGSTKTKLVILSLVAVIIVFMWING
jgi:hypothetical protein